MQMKSQALTALLLLTLTVTVLAAQPIGAAVPKPAVPEFTIQLVDNSTPETITYQINPYTGENESRVRLAVYGLKMHLTIKNQPYPAVVDGNATELHYNVRTKGHYSEEWETGHVESVTPQTAPADGSGYTELVLEAGGFVSRAKVDVQVQAELGYEYYVSLPNHPNFVDMGGDWQTSEWSQTQTVDIPEVTWPYGNSSPTPQTMEPEATSTPQPTVAPTEDDGLPVNADLGLDQTTLTAVIILAVVATTVAFVVVLFVKSRPKKAAV
jgi:hypothetical protein